jgi:mersacidin/lichenicidin family type 2 lantibiotic
MSIKHVVNAWRDEEYRDRLDLGARAALPQSPVGEIDLTDVELSEVEGGTSWVLCISNLPLLCTNAVFCVVN